VYVVSGHSNEIHFQKFIDDVTAATRALAGATFQSGDPASICNALRKMLYILDLHDLHEYLTKNSSSRVELSETEFITVLAERLRLSPAVCTDHQLGLFWSKMASNRPSLPIREVVAFFERNAKVVEDIKIDLLAKLANKEDFSGRFVQDPRFNQNGLQYPIESFRQCLMGF